jgi:hypothetical protein
MQWPKEKWERTNNDIQNTKKIKDWATWTTLKPRANSGAAEGYAVAAPLVDMSLKGDYI